MTEQISETEKKCKEKYPHDIRLQLPYTDPCSYSFGLTPEEISTGIKNICNAQYSSQPDKRYDLPDSDPCKLRREKSDNTMYYIIGGVVGGIVLLLIPIIWYFYFGKSKRSRVLEVSTPNSSDYDYTQYYNNPRYKGNFDTSSDSY